MQKSLPDIERLSGGPPFSNFTWCSATALDRPRRGRKAVSFDGTLFEAAREAFDTYGRRAGVRRLNFGDCLAYAVAKANNVPLLFKGQDFLVTDVRPALS
jgi:uncharacterized protein with PIN domain